jgi:hypothetical protein
MEIRGKTEVAGERKYNLFQEHFAVQKCQKNNQGLSKDSHE